MSKITFENEWAKNRLEYLQLHCNYPKCEMEPMDMNQLRNLKPGTALYIISGSGLNLCMFAYFDKGYSDSCDDLIAVYNHLGTITYKVKNVGKTYNVFKAIVD